MPSPVRDVPAQAIALIQAFEGIPDGDPSTVNLDAYLDPIGIWTIGWGHALRQGNGFLRGAQNRAAARAMFPGGITRVQAEQLLRGDLVETAAAVQRLAPIKLTNGEFGALVAFAFNVGVPALAQSTLLRQLNAGERSAAADQFLVWNKARVAGVLKVLPGLTRRRRAERAMFLGQAWRAAAAAGATPRGRTRRGLMPRGRTTTPKAPPPPKPASRPAPRTRR